MGVNRSTLSGGLYNGSQKRAGDSRAGNRCREECESSPRAGVGGAAGVRRARHVRAGGVVGAAPALVHAGRGGRGAAGAAGVAARAPRGLPARGRGAPAARPRRLRHRPAVLAVPPVRRQVGPFLPRLSSLSLPLSKKPALRSNYEHVCYSIACVVTLARQF